MIRFTLFIGEYNITLKYLSIHGLAVEYSNSFFEETLNMQIVPIFAPEEELITSEKLYVRFHHDVFNIVI